MSKPAAPAAAALPVVVLPVGVDDDGLDACLAALDAGTPPGTRVWLADDARAGPRGHAIVEAWIARTPLQAHYTRRQRVVGDVAHLDEALAACGDADVVVLAPDAQPAPGWLAQLAACLARDAAIATATPWSNAGETAAWPRIGEIAPVPADLERIARACAAMPPVHPELPAAVGHAVALRGSARKRVGGLDAASYGSWHAALVDLSLRLAGLGWRNARTGSSIRKFASRACQAGQRAASASMSPSKGRPSPPRATYAVSHKALRQPRPARRRERSTSAACHDP